jgi:hypothetical protein
VTTLRPPFEVCGLGGVAGASGFRVAIGVARSCTAQLRDGGCNSTVMIAIHRIGMRGQRGWSEVREGD